MNYMVLAVIGAFTIILAYFKQDNPTLAIIGQLISMGCFFGGAIKSLIHLSKYKQVLSDHQKVAVKLLIGASMLGCYAVLYEFGTGVYLLTSGVWPMVHLGILCSLLLYIGVFESRKSQV